MKEKILFVSQRYGLEVNGGAETECRMYAERLTCDYDVEVLTSCALDHVTWKNYYPAGVTDINGVKVHRFPAIQERKRDTTDWSVKIHQSHRISEEKAWIEAQGPVCPELLKFLENHGKEYKAVLFMTYLYYPTVYGLLTDCGTKILIPTAHNELPIYLNIFDIVFSTADKIIYNSRAEKNFVQRRFRGIQKKPSVIAGAGVEYPTGDLPDVSERFHISSPYVCYCGRIEPAKGCDRMFEFFLEYKKRNPGDLKLVLTGKAVMEIPNSSDIVPLGFVSEEEKYAVMQGAQFLIQPSYQESLSIVTLESMLMGRPVLVNGKCAVLKDHCLVSNAGLYYTNYYEFEACAKYLFTHPNEYQEMCENGKEYVKEFYSWDGIIDRIRQLIEE